MASPLSDATVPGEWAGKQFVDAARDIATTVAAEHADDVHRTGRFPSEAIAAVRAAGLLGALVPRSLDGPEASLPEIVAATVALARGCANTAMVFAMHQIQVAILVRHGRTPEIEAFLGELADRQLLVANAFSEMGTAGDALRSVCAIEHLVADRYRVVKDASVVSYGAYADAILLSARREPDASPEDQSLVLCRAEDLHLEPMGEWDSIGLR